MEKRLAFLILALLWGYAPAVLAQAQTINRAVITFDFVSKDVQGTIAGFESSSSISLENLENARFKGSVDVATLDTNNGLRNWSLKNRRYFDADSYPRIYFESTNVNRDHEKVVVEGKLILKGTTRPLTISFQRDGNRLVGHTELFSSDFGIYIKKKRQDNLVRVKIILDLQ